MKSSDSYRGGAETVKNKAESWIEPLARFGYAAKGVVYSIIGIIAALAAVQSGSDTAGSRGALVAILYQPFGRVLLALVAVGLAGHAMWRFVQAIKDTENKGTDAKGIARRIFFAIVGFIYAGLTIFAVRLIFSDSPGGSGGGQGQASQEWTAALMAQPFGQWLVGAVGAGLIGAGIYQFYKAYSKKFREKLNTGEMSEKTEQTVTRIAQVGLSARGVVFGIIGVFLIQAAVGYDPDKVRGISGALRSLEQQPFGPYLLGIVALGLIAFGVYMFVMAWYRRIDVD